MKSLVVLTSKYYVHDVHTFIQNILKAAKECHFHYHSQLCKYFRILFNFMNSFKINCNYRVPINDAKSNTYLSNLEIVINNKSSTFILCVIPSVHGDIYSLIKRKLCIDRAGK